MPDDGQVKCQKHCRSHFRTILPTRGRSLQINCSLRLKVWFGVMSLDRQTVLSVLKKCFLTVQSKGFYALPAGHIDEGENQYAGRV